ncbi:chemotaxis protein CheB [Streptomyces sp. NPDC057694]|uniref:chemotaxis protein CheB n=1 Tax=unclassified Streptomyces TaxID=2593676 RepID=UPI0036BB2F0B
MQTRSQDKDPHQWAAVLVASSAGGIEGLGTLLGGLPTGLSVPVLVAQHLNRSRETHIVSILQRSTGLPVTLAEDGQHAEAGTVYIAPPDHHLCVRAGGMLALTREERVNAARPAADPLFESAAQILGPGIVACVLSGSDGDGAHGVEVVKARGGIVVVQDPATADFHGMPRAAIRTGQVDFVLPLEAIAPAIVDLLRQSVDQAPGPGQLPSA